MSTPSSLKDNLKQLEAIVDWFESDDLDLDEALVKFNEGVKKADQVKEQLTELDNKITVLKQRFDQPDDDV